MNISLPSYIPSDQSSTQKVNDSIPAKSLLDISRPFADEVNFHVIQEALQKKGVFEDNFQFGDDLDSARARNYMDWEVEDLLRKLGPSFDVTYMLQEEEKIIHVSLHIESKNHPQKSRIEEVRSAIPIKPDPATVALASSLQQQIVTAVAPQKFLAEDVTPIMEEQTPVAVPVVVPSEIPDVKSVSQSPDTMLIPEVKSIEQISSPVVKASTQDLTQQQPGASSVVEDKPIPTQQEQPKKPVQLQTQAQTAVPKADQKPTQFPTPAQVATIAPSNTQQGKLYDDKSIIAILSALDDSKVFEKEIICGFSSISKEQMQKIISSEMQKVYDKLTVKRPSIKSYTKVSSKIIGTDKQSQGMRVAIKIEIDPATFHAHMARMELNNLAKTSQK